MNEILMKEYSEKLIVFKDEESLEIYCLPQISRIYTDILTKKNISRGSRRFTQIFK